MDLNEQEEKIYRQAAMEWAFIDFWRMVLDDIKAGRITTSDFKKKPIIKKEQKKKKIIFKEKGRARTLIDNNLKISQVMKNYGIKIEKNNKIICPFHTDTNPSLSFDDNKNIFFCFGCNIKGDIVKLNAMLKKLKNGNNK